MNGILNIYKEAGFTSHDVVAKLRGICQQKKIGHTGTLDPDATGVLPVCFGKATKVCDYLTDHDKTYEVTGILGIATDTQDISGKIVQKRPVAVSSDELRQVICRFIGEISQIPPMYSAIKVQGKKLYELARKGIEVERKARDVTIHSIKNLDIRLENNEFSMTVHCSKGTYIRTLCHDIGEQLGCGAAMKSLVRTRVGIFSLEESRTLSQVQEQKTNGTLENSLIKIEEVFQGLKKAKIVSGAEKYLKNGNILYYNQLQGGTEFDIHEQVMVYNTLGEFAAIYEYLGAETGYKIVKMFCNE